MKNCLSLLSLIVLTLNCRAQQKVNDAMLLDMYQSQHFKEAADYLKSVYQEPITDLKVLSRLAYTYQMANKMPEALAYYQRYYDRDSTNIAVLFSLASISSKRSNNANAIKYFNKITAIDSANFMVYKQLGLLYGDGLDTVNAVKNLQKANRLNAEDADVAAELSFYLLTKKKYKEAEAILQHAIAADSTNIFLLRSLMKLDYAATNYAETINVCKRMLDLGDISSDIYNKQGSSYFELKNYECCIDAFFNLPLAFQTERVEYLMAMSYKRLKDYPNTVKYLNLTLQLSISQNTYAYYNEMADTHQKMHQAKKAVVNYQKSLFFEETPVVFYTLASMYDENLKDKKSAIKYYKKYLDTHPPLKQKQYADYALSRIKMLSGK